MSDYLLFSTKPNGNEIYAFVIFTFTFWCFNQEMYDNKHSIFILFYSIFL